MSKRIDIRTAVVKDSKALARIAGPSYRNIVSKGAKMAAVPSLELNDGNAIPQIGWGVMNISSSDLPEALKVAAKIGYRAIDTAKIYGNEGGVGQAVEELDLARDDLFITTKLWNSDQGYDATLRAFDQSMHRLRLDVLDLYLIHWPTPQFDLYLDTWRAFIRLQEEGRVRSIGVSNFTEAMLERLIAETGQVPTVNQVELHPRFPQAALRAFHSAYGIRTEAWSPLERGRGLLEESGHTDRISLFEEPVILELAARYGRTPAQVVIRWHVELGNVLIPKSTNAGRMAENIDVYDFALTPDDMAAIDTLAGERVGPDPDQFHVR